MVQMGQYRGFGCGAIDARWVRDFSDPISLRFGFTKQSCDLRHGEIATATSYLP
jgi:hypothetical protein